MNKQFQALENMKKDYQDIRIPPELDQVIQAAIEKGRGDRNKVTQGSFGTSNRPASRALKRSLFAAAAAFVIFVAGLNTSPMFASRMAEIPFLGQLVKVLTFTEGRASGGNITDGTDVSGIDTLQQGEKAQFVIRFEQGGTATDLASAYQVVYAQNPETLTFQISGARMLSAVEDFEKLKEHPLVKDVYPLVTLDDSMVRFVIIFSEAVTYEIREMASPASLILEVEKGQQSESEAVGFRIRTEAMPRGEGLAILEETVMFSHPERRILPSETEPERFFLEVGQGATEALALEKLEALKAQYPHIEFSLEPIVK